MTRELVTLAWPIAAAMLGETAMGLVDTKLVGGLGASALGGTGLATMAMFFLYSVVNGLMRGVKVRTAHAIGEGRAEDGHAYVRAGAWMGLGAGVVFMLICRWAYPLLAATGADPEVARAAADFLGAVTFGAPATCMLAALVQHRQAIGDARTPMAIGIGGNAINAALAWTLIYGHLGMPALGVRGAGYATATTEVLEVAVMLLVYAREARRDARLAQNDASGITRARATKVRFREAARHVAELGLPTGLQFAVEMAAMLAFTALLGAMGPSEIAGHQVALTVLRVSFLPGIAVGEAASVLVGRALGARKLGEADAVVWSAVRTAGAFMAACGLVFGLGGGFIASFFTTDHAVAGVARKLMLVGAFFQVLDAIAIVLRGSLRGAKDVRAVAAIGVACVWLFVPTSAYFLGQKLGLGALGGWLGFLAETAVGAVLYARRWKVGAWRASYTKR